MSVIRNYPPKLWLACFAEIPDPLVRGVTIEAPLDLRGAPATLLEL